MTWLYPEAARVYCRARVATARAFDVMVDNVLRVHNPDGLAAESRRLAWWVCREVGIPELVIARLADVDKNTVRADVEHVRTAVVVDVAMRERVALVLDHMARMGGALRREREAGAA